MLNFIQRHRRPAIVVAAAVDAFLITATVFYFLGV
tara:strand:- start:534 stop:638 length:105 start_codon:yes stop_codon:yes gene_type:complete